MASQRRRSGHALSGALDLAGQLYLSRQEQQRQRQEKAAELETKFAQDYALKLIERQWAEQDRASAFAAMQDAVGKSGGQPGGGGGYGLPNISMDAKGQPSMSYDPLSPTEQAKAEEMSLIRQASPMPSDLGPGNMVRTPQGSLTEFTPQERLAGYPAEFARHRLSKSQTPVYGVNAATKELTEIGRVPGNAKVFSAGAAGTTPAEDIEAIADDIVTGVMSPVLSESSSFRDRTRLAAAISRRGLDLMKMQNDWRAIQTATKNANSTQQLRMRQALASVEGSLSTLRELNQQFERMSWRPIGLAQLKLAMTGTDPSKRDTATKFVTQINAMTDELAQGFQGGGVPTETAFRLAREILNQVYGKQQLDAAIDQLETNIRIRLNAIESVQALTPGGEVSEQYERFNRSPSHDARSFKTEADALSANLPKGTRIRVNGRLAVVE